MFFLITRFLHTASGRHHVLAALVIAAMAMAVTMVRVVVKNAVIQGNAARDYIAPILLTMKLNLMENSMTNTKTIAELEAALKNNAIRNRVRMPCDERPDQICADYEIIEHAAIAHLQTLKSGVDKRWVIVPVEPDYTMLRMGIQRAAKVIRNKWDDPEGTTSLYEAWKAMIEAAPKYRSTPPVDADKIRAARDAVRWIETGWFYGGVEDDDIKVHINTIRDLLDSAIKAG